MNHNHEAEEVGEKKNKIQIYKIEPNKKKITINLI